MYTSSANELEHSSINISMKEMNYSNVTARIIYFVTLLKSWTSMFRITSRHLSTGFAHLSYLNIYPFV